MKIFVSTDMEGLPGISAWHHVDIKDKRYLGRYMEETMGWVLEGIKGSPQNEKIDQILVCDSHSLGENMSYDFTELDDRLYLVRGGLRDYYMMAGMDESFSTVFFVGYHAGVGALHGTMDHTYSNTAVHELKINGIRMNETTINAAFAAEYGAPVSLVVGDHALVEELKPIMPDTVLVETKKGLSRFAAIMRPKNVVKREVIEATKKALEKTEKGEVKPYKLNSPYTLEITFRSTEMADEASLTPGVERVSGYTIKYVSDSYKDIMQLLLAVIYASRIATEMGR
jgi:D-amino peptidase